LNLLDIPFVRPVVVIILFGLLAFLGVVAYTHFKYELLPEISVPVVTVETLYPGASPSEVETSVTKYLEDSVAGISHIDYIESQSLEGLSLVQINFKAQTNIETAIQDVQRQVNTVLNKLPTDAKTPLVNKFSFDDMPILQIAATANATPGVFYQFVKDRVLPRVSQLNGVGQVTLTGGNVREIHINVAQDKLAHYGIPILTIQGKLMAANLDFPAGNIKDADGQYVVRIAGKLRTVEEIRNLILVSSPGFGTIKLKDVADVVDTLAESTTISRLNGKDAIGISVVKQVGANAVEVSSSVKHELKSMEAESKDLKLAFEIADDTTTFTLDSANDVVTDILLAIVLVALVIVLFLHDLRNAFIIMMAIPTTLLTTLVIIGQMDFSLNLMSLLAMTLVIGILVDDSIVVVENIHRHRAMGKSSLESARWGSREIGFAAFGITLIIVVAFLPVSVAGGTVGDILKQFGLTIVLATAISLVVSFSVTPLLASRLGEAETHGKKPSAYLRFSQAFDDGFEKISLWYQRTVSWSLAHKKVTIGVSVVFLVATFALAGSGVIGSEFSPTIDRGQFNIVLELPDRTTLEENNRVVTQIEKSLLTRPEVARVFTKVGYATTGAVDNKSQINVTLTPKTQRTKSSIEIGKEIEADILRTPGVKVEVDQLGIVSTGSAPVSYVVMGPNYDDVVTTANRWAKMLKGVEGTGQVRLSSGSSKPELDIDIDRSRMADLGLSLDVVGSSLRTALSGNSSDILFHENNADYAMIVRLDALDRTGTAQIGDFSFVNDRGDRVKLSQFATIRNAFGPNVLTRYDRESSVTITAQAINRASGDINTEAQGKAVGLGLPGVSVLPSGNLKFQSDSFGSLGFALLLSIILIYAIMAILFNSFIYPLSILFSLPFAVIGGLLALALMHQTLNLFSIMSIILLVGLSAKNAILLVDRTLKTLGEGTMDLNHALVEAVQTRIRPIFMTTAAMIFGMLPIAFGLGSSGELKQAIGSVLIGGLLFG